MHKHANRISQRTKKCACSSNTHLALHLLFWISLSLFPPPFFFSFFLSLFFLISPSMQQTAAAIQMVALAPQNLVERRLTVLLHQLYLDLCEVSLLVPLLSILVYKCRFRWQWDAMFNCPILLSSVLINLNVAANISPLLRRGALHCPNWARTLLSG